MAPLAIERMVTTRPGGSSAGAGAPAGSTPNAEQIAMPHERTSARRSPWLGAPRTAATGCPARRASPLAVRRTAVASNPPIATPASCSAATPDSNDVPRAAAACGVKRPLASTVLRGVPSLGSTAIHTPLASVPHASTGESDGWGCSARRWMRGTAAAAAAGGTGISCTTTCLPLLSTAFQPCADPAGIDSSGFGFGSDSGM